MRGKPLSGWMRLWIVFAVIAWAVGGWHLATRAAPPPHMVTAHEVCAIEQPPLRRQSTCAARPTFFIDVQIREAERVGDQQRADALRAQLSESRRQCEAREEREERAAWSRYNACVDAADAPDQVQERRGQHQNELLRYYALAAALIAAVVALPVLVGLLYWLLFRIGRWVWQGFERERAQEGDDR